MKAIIISGMPAAGKTTVAAILADKLGVETIGGGDILRELAARKGYNPEGVDWWDTPEGIKFLKERETNPEYDKEADKILAEKINKGNIIVTSYTAPWLVRDGLKIWLDANVDKRAARMSERDNSDLKETLKTTKVRDKENYRLYKRLYNIDLGKDKKPFDLIISTDDIAAEEVAKIILKKMEELNIS